MANFRLDVSNLKKTLGKITRCPQADYFNVVAHSKGYEIRGFRKGWFFTKCIMAGTVPREALDIVVKATLSANGNIIPIDYVVTLDRNEFLVSPPGDSQSKFSILQA